MIHTPLGGRPHGAAPTDPNKRIGWTETPHPSPPVAVPPSPKGEGWDGGGKPPPYTVRFSWRATTRRAQGPGRAGVVAPHADGASRMPRPTSSAPFVGADVLIGPRTATWGRPYENFDPLLPVGADLRVRPPVLGAHCAPLHGGGGSPLPPLAFGHLPLIGGVVPRPTWFASSVGADLCVRPAKATPPCLTAWGCIMSCDRWGPLTPAWRR